MKKEITLKLDTDAIAYLENMSNALKCSPSDFVEYLVCINMLKFKSYIESILPHQDFDPGGYCGEQTTKPKSGEEVRPMKDSEKRMFEILQQFKSN